MTPRSSRESERGPVGYPHSDWDAPTEVCRQGEHVFAEGDEGAIYCTACTGYRCDTCCASGQVNNGLSMKRCYACSGFGVVMGWDEWPYRINPWNWAEATAKAREAATG